MVIPLWKQGGSMEINPANIHELVAEAAQETKNNEPMVPRTFKVPQDTWDESKRILDANGTTTSAYLRLCLTKLVDDYK